MAQSSEYSVLKRNVQLENNKSIRVSLTFQQSIQVALLHFFQSYAIRFRIWMDES